MRKILFASSEVYPLIKTGGLADVSASLPIALKQQGDDVRVVIPAYRQCLEKLASVQSIASIKLVGFHQPIEILQSRLPNTDVTIWLVHSPQHFDREGGPYGPKSGEDWPDNAARFALFSRAIVAIALNQLALDWQPDILHCNDWQTGLALALIADQPKRPATLFTIHNLAYQGLFSRQVFEALDLPESLWHSEGIEFYNLMSFMKSGLVFADHVTAVSPTYADEICTAEYGCGLEGLLSYLAEQGKLSGILNGIDVDEWNPEQDELIPQNYSSKTIRNKAKNKQLVQQYFGLPEKKEPMLIGLISRLVPQKGIDLSITALDNLLQSDQSVQFICLGSGDADFEHQLRVLRAKYPDKVAIHIGYDEALSHQIEAGVDVFLMPSRFEPCGLNQLYSLRYGTLPIVRNTGGLADSVVDASGEDLKNNFATGFKFEEATVEQLEATLKRALSLFSHPRVWRRVILTAMAQDYSWQKSSQQYHRLYKKLIARR